MKKLIKVCGMRESHNIEKLLKLDIDMMGMIFYDKSPRYIVEVPQLSFNENINKVGVFVNSSFEDIMEIARKFKLNNIQLHGNESVELCERLKKEKLIVMKAFGIDDDFDFSQIKKFENTCSLFVFDTKTKAYGGSGRKFNWNKLKEYQGDTPFLLSGGISLENSSELVDFKHYKYAGVDLNSGFEIKPALKDIGKLKSFIDEFHQ
ncbi:MAG: phosphoribosylanthranilate isomerase [Flavobacteriales bacterium]|nr:phosphoribosylanthranilate isomerase [Flavobacteriales bacterium]